ncbi:efflux RND transporter permease subunit, partial [Cupriavidus sp. SIMBA_020]|uniref:efflux RND transporter permease subunit n=1 Tax=Cupriavidus sp. SIMBA_020 TaxID=3085766 RepID=UPI00397C748D
VVGLIPLLFASGAGAHSRYSLGLVIVVGMLVGTLFTLFVLPTVYTVLARDHRAAIHDCERHVADAAERYQLLVAFLRTDAALHEADVDR